MGETEHDAEKALVVAQCERRLLLNSNKIAKLREKVRDLTTERDRLTEDVDALREHIGQLARSCDNRDALIEETITERDRLREAVRDLWPKVPDYRFNALSAATFGVVNAVFGMTPQDADARDERERAVWAIKHIRAIHEAWCDPTDQGERTVGDRVGEALIALMNDPALWAALDAPPAGREGGE